MRCHTSNTQSSRDLCDLDMRSAKYHEAIVWPVILDIRWHVGDYPVWDTPRNILHAIHELRSIGRCTHDPPGGVGKANEFSNDGRWNRPRESDNWDADKVQNPECTESFAVFVIGRYFVYFVENQAVEPLLVM